jgi:aspartyl aminopeptidase
MEALAAHAGNAEVLTADDVNSKITKKIIQQMPQFYRKMAIR